MFLIIRLYIGCLSVNLIGQMSAEPQVDATQVNGAEIKVSHLSHFAFTNSVHPVHTCLCQILLTAALHQYLGNY